MKPETRKTDYRRLSSSAIMAALPVLSKKEKELAWCELYRRARETPTNGAWSNLKR